MNDWKMTESDLRTEINNLLHKYNSLKELYLKEISELKLALEKLRRDKERYRLAYMTSPDSINLNRLSDGMYVSVNEGFTNILGYTEADSIGKTSLEMNIWASPEDRAHMVSEVKANGKIKDFEARFISKDGRIIIGSFSATVIDLDGVPHILSVVRDITTHKEAEEALAEEQFLINALMNNLSDHVYFKDLESRFIKNNKAHALSFGQEDPAQVIGKSDFDFFTDDAAQQAYEDEQQLIKTGQPILKEEKLTRIDSSDAWFSAIKTPLRNKV